MSEASGDNLDRLVRWSDQQQTWVEDVWEPCPLHERTKGASERCKLCKGAGEVLIEVECDPPNH
jgi:hypothetical protein